MGKSAHLNRSLLGSVGLAPSDSVPFTKRVPVEPEVHASLPRLFALPKRASGQTKKEYEQVGLTGCQNSVLVCGSNRMSGILC